MASNRRKQTQSSEPEADFAVEMSLVEIDHVGGGKGEDGAHNSLSHRGESHQLGTKGRAARLRRNSTGHGAEGQEEERMHDPLQKRMTSG
ncbi:hypothetical protein MY10362_000351 [Beauveria mimosiformis]